MTIGIYSIFLGEPDKYYIGQSVNINRRIIQHKSLLNNNKHHNVTMQIAYNTTKIFVSSIIIECATIDLDNEEVKYINSKNTLLLGYNKVSGGTSGRGLDHGSCKYTEEQITNAFILLLDHKASFEFISEITELSISAIRHLACRDTHRWLDDKYPEHSAKLISILNNKSRISANTRGISHKFTKIQDPEGNIYAVEPTITKFSRLHGLDANKVGALLLGNRNTHKGWIAVDRIE